MVTKLICSSLQLYSKLLAMNLDVYHPEENVTLTLRKDTLTIGDGYQLYVEGSGDGSLTVYAEKLIKLRKILKRVEEQPIVLSLSSSYPHFAIQNIAI